jgi:hypothetical protein
MRFLDLTLNILAASRLLQLSITISLRGELAKPLITVQSLKKSENSAVASVHKDDPYCICMAKPMTWSVIIN